ncbi:MAG: DUF4089 domain-containing protein [Alphaproteobacteria bacterium]|nr:DUF4089 domain-containing protein [Alphaproteobacteria bacterium]
MTRKRTKARPARKTQSRARKTPKPRTPQAGGEPLDALIAAGARSLGLKIDRRWMAEIRNQLTVTLRHGASVAEFRLLDDAEPAPVFEA